MIKICYIIGQLNRAGAEQQLFYLVKGINKQKFHPVVVSLSQGGYWCKEFQKLNIQVIEIPRRKKKEIIRLFRLIRLLNKLKPTIVHAYLISGNFYGRIAAILTRVPVIIASERNLPEIGKDKNMLRMWIDKCLALFTDGIICNSYKASQALLLHSFAYKKVFTVHNGIDGSYLEGHTNLNDRKKVSQKVIGTVGRLYPQKNYRLFLDMAKAVLDKTKNRDMKFMIVGDGPLKNELKDYSKSLGIESSVFFAGERSNIPELLQVMDIFVMTSLYEGLPNSLMEAMLAGLPVVATDVGGNNELVIDKITGFLCPSNNVSALSNAICYLIENENEATQMGKNGQKRILNEFGIKKMVLSTENIYQRLLERKKINYKQTNGFQESLN